MKSRIGLLAAIAGTATTVVAAAGAVLLVPSSAASPDDGALGPGKATVELIVRHSRFSPRLVRVKPHTEVRFVVENRDPIGHELIVGGPDVHARHEGGREAAHPPRAGEVSVGAHRRASTSYTFHEPGTVRYACHLPGHFAYGMRGRVVVGAA